MKLFIAITTAILILLFIKFQIAGELAEKALAKTQEQTKKLQEKANEIHLKSLEKQREMRQEAYDAELIKVFVKAKDAKKCMQMLDTKVIDNEVVECNKDHYVQIRRDELDEFKRTHDIK